MKSLVAKLGPVPFPSFTKERLYMVPFEIDHGALIVPVVLRRWVRTLRSLIGSITGHHTCYIMVDQAEVAAGQTHRRGGPHIDGNWIPSKGWSTGGIQSDAARAQSGAPERREDGK